ASCTVLNTGTPSISRPPLPGVTPPTIFVPYSSICFVWKRAVSPVIPCTITFVSLLMNTLMPLPRLQLQLISRFFVRRLPLSRLLQCLNRIHLITFYLALRLSLLNVLLTEPLNRLLLQP